MLGRGADHDPADRHRGDRPALHNPVLLAEQAATLDLLSGGRLDFGVGRGYRRNEFDGFCLPIDEAEERFEEALDVIVKSFTSETPFSHRGKHWCFADITVEPPPAQRPHPPIWMAAGSPASVRKVAARGFNLLLDQFASPEQLGERIALFKAEAAARGRKVGPMEIAVARNCFVAYDAAEKAAAIDRQIAAHQRMVALSRHADGGHKSHILAYADDPGATEASALIGMPDEIARGLEALRAVGVHYVLLNGGAEARDSLRRLTKEMMPAFGDA